MRDPEIVSGEYDKPFSDEDVVTDDGNVNLGAVFRADPGVRKCPGCQVYYWNLASVMKCVAEDCKTTFGDGVKYE